MSAVNILPAGEKINKIGWLEKKIFKNFTQNSLNEA
jgi:hypothetical protein